MIQRLTLAATFALLASTAHALAPPTQPPEERARQMLFPKSPDPLWQVLAHSVIKTDLARGIFVADHPPEVRALDGQEVTIKGFMLETSITSPFLSFVLTRYTPVCAFCPPGAPNEAVQVDLTRFARPKGGLLTVRGRMKVDDDGASGLFFRLERAEILAE